MSALDEAVDSLMQAADVLACECDDGLHGYTQDDIDTAIGQARAAIGHINRIRLEAAGQIDMFRAER